MEFFTDLILETNNQINEKALSIFNLYMINDYYHFLKENTVKKGFFSQSDNNKIASRHIYECMIYIYHLLNSINVSRETSILDVGSGPGLPGFLFYCLKEYPKITLLDSSERRLKAIEDYSFEKKYSLQFIYKRAEEYEKEFDMVTFRALIPFPFSVKLVRHLAKNFICIFGGKIEITNEIENYLKKLEVENLKIIPIEELKFLGERNLIIIFLKTNNKKMKPTKWNILRREIKNGLRSSNS